MAEKRESKWILQDTISVVLKQCQNNVSFQKKGSGFISKFLQNLLTVSSIHKKATEQKLRKMTSSSNLR